MGKLKIELECPKDNALMYVLDRVIEVVKNEPDVSITVIKVIST